MYICIHLFTRKVHPLSSTYSPPNTHNFLFPLPIPHSPFAFPSPPPFPFPLPLFILLSLPIPSRNLPKQPLLIPLKPFPPTLDSTLPNTQTQTHTPIPYPVILVKNISLPLLCHSPTPRIHPFRPTICQ